ncbi:MAG: hypothetical protein PWR03_2140 [Tenuifilum sp.]|nr:hypothetical protein [Tenuifilum sp.]
MRSVRYILLLASILLVRLAAADTLTIMQYNLMYYDKEYSDCNSTNNNVDAKDGYLRTILEYVQPDILTVNEVNDAVASVERIKTNTLNVNGVTRYKRANFSGDFLVNMIYYNSEKLELKSQEAISTYPRETNVYKLYLITPNLVNGDTIFIYHLVTHLKAGSYDSDAQARATAATKIMDYLVTNGVNKNVILSGDMNLYGASEAAFVKFTTPAGSNNFRLYDPLNMVGEWHNDYQYRYIHTQSTRTYADNGCFSTGGLDDRFDFILTSSDILSGTSGIKFHSYVTLGQDGNRYNSSVVSPSNTSVPSEVAYALYNMSDHLPVIMKVTYTSENTSASTTEKTIPISYNNPVNDILRINVLDPTPIKSIYIFNILGNMVYSNSAIENHTINIDFSQNPSGIYLATLQLADNRKRIIKIIK